MLNSYMSSVKAHCHSSADLPIGGIRQPEPDYPSLVFPSSLRRYSPRLALQSRVPLLKIFVNVGLKLDALIRKL